jgi:uncharacterized protein YicC (UPF0701 family)
VKGSICAPSSIRAGRSLAISSNARPRQPRPDHGTSCALAERVRELQADVSVEEATIAQEIVRFANRSRYYGGDRQVPRPHRALAGAVRRAGTLRPKLDFLLQEMNREVNTPRIEG